MRKRILRSSALLASSIAALVPHPQATGQESSKYSKKLRESVLTDPEFRAPDAVGMVDPPARSSDRYPWKQGIVTTTFWIGEAPTRNNPVPNHVSSWDSQWAKNYGGTDDPARGNRANYIPTSFTPGQNPFYIALPYNDITRSGHKSEAASVVPWFKQAFQGPGKTVLKGRWIAIRFKARTCYAQWEDCGPFRTDHWQYVFGNERPKPNLNRGAGLDVSPAVRDFLGMADTDVTDWKFVDFEEVPTGPWANLGENNTFVINKRRMDTNVVDAKKKLLGKPTPGS